jgi:membrane-bound serine protease (ClpP class)
MVFQSLRRALLFGVVVSALLLGATLRADAPVSPDSSSNSHVMVLRIDGEIEPILAQYISDGIAQAARQHDNLVLITMNTRGGLDDSMRKIVQAVLSSSVPVAIYVSPSGARGASAGFFILLSADIAAMAPGTNTGAASPVFEMFGQTVQIDETMRKKVTNDASAFLRSYAEMRGRNPDVASTAVTDAKAFSATEALNDKLINLVASSEEDLLSKLNGQTIARFDGSKVQLQLSHPVLTELAMTSRQKALLHIVDPNIAFLLLIGGVLGLYTEFTHPGMFAPGVLGGVALLVALFAMNMLPVSITGILLIALALTFFVLEAKFPTHGVLGVGGVIALILGALLLIQSPWTGMGVSFSTAVAVAIPFALIVLILARAVRRSRGWKMQTGKEELIGEEGEVTQAFVSGAGMVRVHGELWRAATPSGQTIPEGSWIRVRKVNGLTLEVEPSKRPEPVSS